MAVQRHLGRKPRASIERELRRELSLIRRIGIVLSEIVNEHAEQKLLPAEHVLKWAGWASNALHAQAGIKQKAKPVKQAEEDDDLDQLLGKFLDQVGPERRASILQGNGDGEAH